MSLLDYAGFKLRTVMPSQDVDHVAGIYWSKPYADASPSAALIDQPVGQVTAAGDITLLQFIPNAPLVADPSNYATLNIYKRTAGGAPVLLGTLDTSTTSWAAKIPALIVIGLSSVLAGDVISFEIVKSGTGVIIPSGELDVVSSPNYIEARIAVHESRTNSRLRKNYAVPFKAPAPEIYLDWIQALVTVDAYTKRGRNPNDPAMLDATAAATRALDEMKEASNSQDGLFELPLREDIQVSGRADLMPLASSQQSPYVGHDAQARDGRIEDSNSANGLFDVSENLPLPGGS